MDRQGIIAVALAIAVLVFWQIENTKKTNLQLAEKQRAEEVAREKLAVEAPAETPSPTAAPISPAAPNEPPATEQIDTVGTPAVEYSFTNLGGGIQRAVLKKHQAEHGSNVIMNQFGTHPIGALSEKAGDDSRLGYTKEAGGAGEVSFTRTDTRQVQIHKTFTLPKEGGATDEYVTQLEVTFTNAGAQAVQLPAYFVYTGSAAPIHQIDQAMYTGAAWIAGGKFTLKNASSFAKGGLFGMGHEDLPTFQQDFADTAWAAVTNQYFSSIVVPLDDTRGSGVWAHRFEVDKSMIGTPPQEAGGLGLKWKTQPSTTNAQKAEAVDGALAMPGFTLQPGEKAVRKFQIYTGPREYQRLKALGHGEDDIMDFGMFRAVSKLLLNTMNWLHSKFGSYALAIIALTIIIRGLMWPLQNKSTQSMKKMQALNPMMTELKAKYKDDPARMNQELMKLYKDYQINPLAGCLPMFVQIPVFFGFFSMLGKAVELRHAKFLWVKDLSQMDTVATIAGQPLNVLPLCMAVTMLWQMSLSPKTGDAVQQRVMMFMPLIFIFFCYKYASALALYWTVQNIFTVVQLYITKNQAAPVLQKVSASSKKR